MVKNKAISSPGSHPHYKIVSLLQISHGKEPNSSYMWCNSKQTYVYFIFSPYRKHIASLVRSMRVLLYMEVHLRNVLIYIFIYIWWEKNQPIHLLEKMFEEFSQCHISLHCWSFITSGHNVERNQSIIYKQRESESKPSISYLHILSKSV